MMIPNRHIQASVLVTTVVVAVLMSLAVLSVLALWETDRLFFARANYLRNQRACLESGFVLYARTENPDTRLNEEGAIQLFDSIPTSKIYLAHRAWGLYEVVCAATHDRKMVSVRLFGSQDAPRQKINFYYPSNNHSFTITGKTTLKGKLALPQQGVQYGRMQSVFFSGEKARNTDILQSGKELPRPADSILSAIDRYFGLLLRPEKVTTIPDSLNNRFYDTEPIRIHIGSGTLSGCILKGNIVLTGEELHIDPSCRIDGILLIARSVTIGKGFRGRIQIMVTDSATVQQSAVLDYPSGILLRNREKSGGTITLSKGSQVNGYIIADLPPGSATGSQTPNYRQARTAIVRGMVYVSGSAQLQGLVSGSVYLGKSVYTSSSGRYDDLLYDVTVLENELFARPLWLESTHPKKEMVWLD